MKISQIIVASLLLSAFPGSLAADGDHGHPSLERRIEALEKALSQGVPVNREQLRRLLSEMAAAEGPVTPPIPPKTTPSPPVATPGPTPPTTPPPPQQSARTLDECKALLTAQGGGWCEMRVPGDHPSISAHYPVVNVMLRGVVGPEAILGAWNSAAYDRENQVLYFSGGGHADYGGNEFYRFEIETGKWERLTDPSPLTHTYTERGTYLRMVNDHKVPSSAHTYDGLLWNTKTKTIYYMTMAPYNARSTIIDNPTEAEKTPIEQGGLLTGGKEIHQYEFNPSKTETRNGIAPLGWRRVSSHPKLIFAKSAQWPDGEMWMAGNGTVFRATGTESLSFEQLASHGDAGDGIMFHDPKRNIMWVSAGGRIWAYNQAGQEVARHSGVPRGAWRSGAIDDAGIIHAWDGQSRVYRFDPDNADKGWEIRAGGPTEGVSTHTYEKFVHIGEGFFGGISIDKTGFWIYKPRTGGAVTPIERTDPQTFIDAAAPGSTVTIPPGIYAHGIRIDKSLTVNLKDVQLWGLKDRKGIVNIQGDGITVVVNDLVADGLKANATGSNASGIRITGVTWNVTVNRAHISSTVMGILTDNRGGKLTVNDSVISRTGNVGTRSALSHGLYAGSIDELIVKNSRIEAPQRLGHVLKSRARVTTFTDGALLGLDGRHSRMVDLSCGGKFTFQRNMVQQGTNTDNTEMMAISYERLKPGGCNDLPPADVTITDNTFVFDRDKSADEPARNYGANFLMGWRHKIKAVSIRNNRIIDKTGQFKWIGEPDSVNGKGGVELPDNLDSLNTRFPSREAAGLKPGDNTVP